MISTSQHHFEVAYFPWLWKMRNYRRVSGYPRKLRNIGLRAWNEMCDFFWINYSELTGTVTVRNDDSIGATANIEAGHGLMEHPPLSSMTFPLPFGWMPITGDWFCAQLAILLDSFPKSLEDLRRNSWNIFLHPIPCVLKSFLPVLGSCSFHHPLRHFGPVVGDRSGDAGFWPMGSWLKLGDPASILAPEGCKSPLLVHVFSWLTQLPSGKLT